jgi:DNA-binding protein H-NS
MTKRLESLEAVLSQIEKLQAVADEIRQRERAAVIARVREAMATYQITAKELTAKEPAPAPVEKIGKGAAMSGRIKYRGPEGQVWSGFGHHPKWVQLYLEAGKKNKLTDLLTDEFREPKAAAA